MSMSDTSFGRQIDFVTDWSDTSVFSDLRSVAKVDSPERMLEQWREPPAAPAEGGAEATVGRFETVDASLLAILARHSRAVCRIVVPPGNYTDYRDRGANSTWFGTGFLVSPNILLTNHHVLNSTAVAEAATAEFEYQITQAELQDGPPDTIPSATRFRLNPARLFITSSMKDFDYTFVWIDPGAATQFGHVTMTRGSFTVRKTEPTYIIHHPGGDPKQVSLDDTEVLSINSSAVLYAADTAGGSSGAPVFCRRGRLVALHHAWWSISSAKARYATLDGRLNDGGSTNVVNEGIKLSAIAIDLERRVAGGGSEGSAAATVLQAFTGSDTMTGLFGSLGRHRATATPKPVHESTAGASAYEHVVQVYQGNEMDIDIGSWNIEWLNRDYRKPGRLDRVATVITDLNLDIWALVEVSPDAVAALLDVLATKFKQTYHVAYSEPDASSGKQTTAVIWRPTIVEGERADWPDRIDELFGLDSRDDLPFEAVHGKIFNRYPGLFRFKIKSETKAFDFYLVPLHLKARGEGSLRRQLASKALSYAVDQMIENHGADKDWVLLGDVNATLASEDFDPLTAKGFTPLSASDEASGAFTYLKAPYKSLIDTIFVSQNLRRLVDEDDFYIVETDKSVSRFIDETSDHRPIAMRLSLADLPDIETAQETATPNSRSADAIFRQKLVDLGLAVAAGPSTPPVAADAPAAMAGWLTDGRTKPEFFRDNRASLERVTATVNADLQSRYGPGAMPLSLQDVAVIVMAEAGITPSGQVDPGFVHSNGEFGLLPLPRNIDFWLVHDAPAFDDRIGLDENIRLYLAYLGALKNKLARNVDGLGLYPDLFTAAGIDGNIPRQARLLAGVVHGYFWSGNYSDRQVPIQALLGGFASDLPVADMLRHTTYVHAGKPFLDGRQRNIDLGLALV
ncbi:trypsin-like peptidase domain-containing protein [Microbulbifer sp. S227A]|uniref:trypsin-like peptidase domain-containing protein n=1 Tax=Microbulbifer sp. S227A TaxID=3415131 RepID=UPI003C7C06F1